MRQGMERCHGAKSLKSWKWWSALKSGRNLNQYKASLNYLNLFLFLFLALNCSHDQLVMIAERLIQEADKNSKGTVDFEEFMEAVTEVDIEGKMAFITFY